MRFIELYSDLSNQSNCRSIAATLYCRKSEFSLLIGEMVDDK